MLPENQTFRSVYSNRVFACAAGFLFVLSATMWPGPMTALILTAGLLVITWRASERWGDRRPFVLFASGLAVRLAFIGLIALATFGRSEPLSIFGDSSMFFRRTGHALLSFRGDFHYESSLVPGLYGYTFLYWIFGAISLLAGYSPFLMKTINIVFSCLSAWLIYLIAFRITGRRGIAAWVMGLTIFWPSNMMWSLDMLKEPSIQLYSVIVIYLFVDMIVRKRWQNLIWLAVLWYPVGHLRSGFHLLVLLTLLLSAVLFIPCQKKTGLTVLLFCILAGAAALGPGRARELYIAAQYKIVGSQIGFITTGGSYYKFIPERFQPRGGDNSPMSLREFAESYVKSVFYYLGTPRPYQKPTFNKLPTLPQMILWYFMLFVFMPAGVLYLLRYRYRESGAVLVFLLVGISAAALLTGNEGTAFRHRDIFTPFMFIPITIGMYNVSGWLTQLIRNNGHIRSLTAINCAQGH